MKENKEVDPEQDEEFLTEEEKVDPSQQPISRIFILNNNNTGT